MKGNTTTKKTASTTTVADQGSWKIISCDGFKQLLVVYMHADVVQAAG